MSADSFTADEARREMRARVFAWLARVMRRRDIAPGAAKVAWALADSANDNAVSWRTAPDLGEMVGLHEKNVRAHIETLEGLGEVRVEVRRNLGLPSLYWLSESGKTIGDTAIAPTHDKRRGELRQHSEPPKTRTLRTPPPSKPRAHTPGGPEQAPGTHARRSVEDPRAHTPGDPRAHTPGQLRNPDLPPNDPPICSPKESARSREGANAPLSEFQLTSVSHSKDPKRSGREAKTVEAVFELWKEQSSKPRARLDNKRRVKIQCALKTYGAAMVEEAIRGCCASEWNREKNQLEISMILRDAEHIERYADLHRRGAKPGLHRAAPKSRGISTPARATETTTAEDLFGAPQEVIHG